MNADIKDGKDDFKLSVKIEFWVTIATFRVFIQSWKETSLLCYIMVKFEDTKKVWDLETKISKLFWINFSELWSRGKKNLISRYVIEVYMEYSFQHH